MERSIDNDNVTRGSGIWLKAANVVVGLCGLTCVGLGIYFLLQEKAALAGTGLTGGVILLLLSTVDRFEFIKGMGIEAKTRDLRKEIDNADQILGQIKEISSAFAPSLVSIAANSGRMSGSQPPELVYKLARAADKLLSAAGESRQAVRQALAPWARMAALDITHGLMVPVEQDAHKELTKRNKALQDWPQPIRAGDEGHAAAVSSMREASRWVHLRGDVHLWSPARCASELRQLARDMPGFIDKDVATKFRAEVETWAPEIEHLAESDDFRDPSQWLKRLHELHQRP